LAINKRIVNISYYDYDYLEDKYFQQALAVRL